MPPSEPTRTPQLPPPLPERQPWTKVLGTNRERVGWLRTRLERPRSAWLTTRGGRRALAGAHLCVAVGLAAQFPLAQRLPVAWIVVFLPLLFGTVIVTGLLHAVTFGMIALDDEDLDERQRLIRGDAHRRAHGISGWLVFVPVLWLSFWALVDGPAGVAERWLADPWIAVAVVALVAVAVAAMPAYVLAWSALLDDPEPDEGPDRGGHGGQ